MRSHEQDPLPFVMAVKGVVSNEGAEYTGTLTDVPCLFGGPERQQYGHRSRLTSISYFVRYALAMRTFSTTYFSADW